MLQIKSILADCDGTVIEHGKINGYHPKLPEILQQARNSGLAFSLASGRDYYFLEKLHQSLVGSPIKNEGILYESCCLRLFGNHESYILGGLTSQQVKDIRNFVRQQDKSFLQGLAHLPEDQCETVVSWVTEEFARRGPTNFEVLERQYQIIKPIIEPEFPYTKVIMTSDAIDIEGKDVSKAQATQKYSELTGIPLHQIAVIGDSSNDLPMFEVVGKAGGLVIYVGEHPQQEKEEKIIKKYQHHFISEEKGSAGMAEGIEYILTKP